MISKTFPFVTGATESWGLATVKAFADVNAYVVLVDINMKGLQFAMTTGNFTAQCDVSDESPVKFLILAQLLTIAFRLFQLFFLLWRSCVPDHQLKIFIH